MRLDVELPADLKVRAEEYLKAGFHPSMDALISEALRRYLDSHSVELTEKFILEDVAWGLNRKD